MCPVRSMTSTNNYRIKWQENPACEMSREHSIIMNLNLLFILSFIVAWYLSTVINNKSYLCNRFIFLKGHVRYCHHLEFMVGGFIIVQCKTKSFILLFFSIFSSPDRKGPLSVIHKLSFFWHLGGHRGCDRMVVGFITTYAINAYHH